ncbi:helix-turn-helix transcriptional regulator [Arthrobacter sp. M4]|uniref:helix-turn-helix transcriptional regulator n=1 Tax=Arthrobacter sp. M4 TaxID=218160 RepID=UPI001CDC493E|nr:helix-turn-helix transcriptional regulator [Arthrobacter sp. M4]MCA4135406.1 helix-turn-helix transcriptional regulator [Arthrobacter sp. M4]
MDIQQEVREFLTSRRSKITPEQAGLAAGTRRRVPGLRRSEVAALAGVSVEYYAKLERGHVAGVSPAVLEGVARALQLDDVERAHLLHLVQAADGSDTLARPRPRPSTEWTPSKSLQWTLAAVTGGPAFVLNGRLDLLAANQLARAFFADMYSSDTTPPNMARFQFLNPVARRFYPDWDVIADMTVDVLRTEAGRNPHDKELHDLVGELCTRSDAFRTRWGAHNVIRHGAGSKRFHHPVVGDLTLTWQGSSVDAEPGLTLLIYTAEPGSVSEEALRLLASWSATQQADSSTESSTQSDSQQQPRRPTPRS